MLKELCPSQILNQKSAKKVLTVAMLTCKLTLIVIVVTREGRKNFIPSLVVTWKLYSE